MKIVSVEWVDSWGQGGHWIPKDVIEDLKPCSAFTVGIVIKE